jgi:hypothetical protein
VAPLPDILWGAASVCSALCVGRRHLRTGVRPLLHAVPLSCTVSCLCSAACQNVTRRGLHLLYVPPHPCRAAFTPWHAAAGRRYDQTAVGFLLASHYGGHIPLDAWQQGMVVAIFFFGGIIGAYLRCGSTRNVCRSRCIPPHPWRCRLRRWLPACTAPLSTRTAAPHTHQPTSGMQAAASSQPVPSDSQLRAAQTNRLLH